MSETGAFWLVVALFAAALALSGCAAGGSSRECSFARPLVFSKHTIAGMDPEDARALLAFNETVQAVCR